MPPPDDHIPDEELWSHIAKTVKPIKRDISVSDTTTKKPNPPSKKRTTARPIDIQISLSSGKAQPPSESPNPGLDRRTEERLRRGKMPINARLDLHGMIQDEAHAALEQFILHAYERGHRCILVITGKGRSRNSEGILKRRVPEWLTMPPIRNIILRVVKAQPQDGGEGALYVLLRRKRS